MKKWYEKHIERVAKLYDARDNDGTKRLLCPCTVKFTDSDTTFVDKADSVEPDFNWQSFWRCAKKHYPLHSVYGGESGKNPAIIKFSEYTQAQRFCTGVDFKGKRVLEIGYGFGGAKKFFMDSGATEYHGIDYTKSDRDMTAAEGFHTIKKSGIPKKLMKNKFDVVYSENVFQHMTAQQREEYYEQVSNVLNNKGLFVVSFFSKTKDFKENPDGTDYGTMFFGVKTAVDEKQFL